MTYYAWIENGEVTRINLTLPCAFDTMTIGTSGHPQLLPIVGDEPAYDPATQRMAGPQYQIDGDVVRRVYTVEDIPSQELDEQRKANIKAQIAALDLRRIRPLAEGDTEYLATLNAQITELRSQL